VFLSIFKFVKKLLKVRTLPFNNNWPRNSLRNLLSVYDSIHSTCTRCGSTSQYRSYRSRIICHQYYDFVCLTCAKWKCKSKTPGACKVNLHYCVNIRREKGSCWWVASSDSWERENCNTKCNMVHFFFHLKFAHTHQMQPYPSKVDANV